MEHCPGEVAEPFSLENELSGDLLSLEPFPDQYASGGGLPVRGILILLYLFNFNLLFKYYLINLFYFINL